MQLRGGEHVKRAKVLSSEELKRMLAIFGTMRNTTLPKELAAYQARPDCWKKLEPPVIQPQKGGPSTPLERRVSRFSKSYFRSLKNKRNQFLT